MADVLTNVMGAGPTTFNFIQVNQSSFTLYPYKQSKLELVKCYGTQQQLMLIYQNNCLLVTVKLQRFLLQDLLIVFEVSISELFLF